MTDNELHDLIAQRQQIDQALLERHSTLIGVLFTDIVGSTSFYEAKGDIAGLARVKRHNEILFPCVEATGGRIVKTIGDAIMAVFDDPTHAIDCGVAMQRALREGQKDDDDPIRIRIGAHAGRVMLDEGDVYGDTVNTAARIEAAAGGDELWVSSALFELLGPDSKHQSLGEQELPLKGKAEPVTLVRIRCFDDDVITGDARNEALLDVEVRSSASGLQVSARDHSAAGTLRAVDDLGVGAADLEEVVKHLGALAHAGGEAGYLDELKRAGKDLFDRGLSPRVREMVTQAEHRFMALNLDDDLVHLPWELMYDGKRFLSERFAIGRMVATRDAPNVKNSEVNGAVLIVSNPAGDLTHAEREGRSIASLFEQRDIPHIHLEGATTKAAFLQAAKGARLLHFAGHARTGASDRSGLVFADGVLSLSELQAGLDGQAPAFIFLNSCFSSSEQGWQASAKGSGGFAAGLLTTGTEHYLSPSWAIDDDDAAYFALRFYESLVRGAAFGEAVRVARESTRVAGHKRPLSHASYVLYGEPRRSLTGVQIEASRARRVRASVATRTDVPGQLPNVRPTPVTQQHVAAPSAVPSSSPNVFAIAGGVIAIAAVVIVAIVALNRDPTPPPTPPPTTTTTVPVAALKAPDPAPLPADPKRHTGDVRMSILPFKNASGQTGLDALRGGMVETLSIGFNVPGMKLIERAQVDVDIEELEFSQTKYVDPKTRAQLGKIKGAEVVILGSFQATGTGKKAKMRATARFVDVESGEVVKAVRVSHKGDDHFELQDKLAAAVKKAAPDVVARLRP